MKMTYKDGVGRWAMAVGRIEARAEAVWNHLAIPAPDRVGPRKNGMPARRKDTHG